MAKTEALLGEAVTFPGMDFSFELSGLGVLLSLGWEEGTEDDLFCARDDFDGEEVGETFEEFADVGMLFNVVDAPHLSDSFSAIVTVLTGFEVGALLEVDMLNMLGDVETWTDSFDDN
jgi:hypothetical protein